MYTFAFRLTGKQQDAEDLVQDVVAKLFPRLDELERVEDLRPWLNRVLYRHFIDTLRRRPAGREVSLSVYDGDDDSSLLDRQENPEPNPMQQTNARHHGRVLRRLLDELHPDQRTLLLLHDRDGWRQEDIAEVLGVPVGTIKSRIHRIRASLREKLQQELEPFDDQTRQAQ